MDCNPILAAIVLDYIGEATRLLRKKIVEHKYTIKNNVSIDPGERATLHETKGVGSNLDPEDTSELQP